MIKVKLNQLSLNDVIYDTGDRYACHHELEKKKLEKRIKELKKVGDQFE